MKYYIHTVDGFNVFRTLRHDALLMGHIEGPFVLLVMFCSCSRFTRIAYALTNSNFPEVRSDTCFFGTLGVFSALP